MYASLAHGRPALPRRCGRGPLCINKYCNTLGIQMQYYSMCTVPYGNKSSCLGRLLAGLVRQR